MIAARPTTARPGQRLMLCGLVALTLSACGIFGEKEDEALLPIELVDIEETLDVRRVWSAKLGGGSEALRVALSPAYDGNRVYAASFDGNVTAYDPINGDRLWRTELDMTLSAGPGVGAGLVIVSGYDGELIALNAEDGSEAWRVNTVGESLARPVISGDSVIHYTNDGRLRVYSTFDGDEQWEFSQDLPALTLRGSSTPVVVNNTVIAGFDNGRLIASDLDAGELLWDAVITPATGRSDLDRLADVDGALAVVGQDVYASGYQGRVASLAAESGQVLWARELSGYSGLAADWENIYVIADDGEVIALLRRNGNDVWRNASLLRREPTTPVAFHTTVVVGDLEGYVHFFSSEDGAPVARERVGKGMVSGEPVVAGDRLLVQSESGTLYAFAVREPEPPEEPADAAAPENDADVDST